MTVQAVDTETRTIVTADTGAEHGVVLFIPLDKLKASPRNARKTPHRPEAIEALAASIAAKTVIQPPVVEPERGESGAPTGCYLVTVGEGRRQALRLLAKRKQIKKTHPVRCVLDLQNDPHEISLDENVTRSDMHPADQFEAFREQAERRGFSAEEIGARFGVAAQVVRQRLRLGAVSPRLMAAYRAEEVTLDQLMAFAVSEDHARQEQVFEQLSWNRAPHLVRRAMTEAKMAATDRRALFVGLEAYAEAGGTILRDLFTEDGGGWLEDVALVEQLVAGKLDGLALEVREREGWKWAEAHIDYPHGHGLGRAYPGPVIHSSEDLAAHAALEAEQDALAAQWEAVEDLPPEVETRLREIEIDIAALDDGEAYALDDIQRGGVFVVLGHDGMARIERGLIRPEDEPPVSSEEEDAEGETVIVQRPATTGDGEIAPEDEEADGLSPLPERLVLDLTAHRTLGLRNALAVQPTLALTAVVHALALRAFYASHEQPTCLELRLTSAPLDSHAAAIMETPAGRLLAERHEAWAARLPRRSEAVWAFIGGLDSGALLDLLAHCAALSINAVRVPWERKPGAWAHADVLATAASLDMAALWSATVDSYLGRVTKARIREAVGEGVSPDAAQRIADLKKAPMAQEAETLLAGTGWLPPLLRTANPHEAASAMTVAAE
jgi:ParB family chromosome partitioning protein